VNTMYRVRWIYVQTGLVPRRRRILRNRGLQSLRVTLICLLAASDVDWPVLESANGYGSSHGDVYPSIRSPHLNRGLEAWNEGRISVHEVVWSLPPGRTDGTAVSVTALRSQG